MDSCVASASLPRAITTEHWTYMWISNGQLCCVYQSALSYNYKLSASAEKSHQQIVHCQTQFIWITHVFAKEYLAHCGQNLGDHWDASFICDMSFSIMTKTIHQWKTETPCLVHCPQQANTRHMLVGESKAQIGQLKAIHPDYADAHNSLRGLKSGNDQPIHIQKHQMLLPAIVLKSGWTMQFTKKLQWWQKSDIDTFKN